MAGMRNKAVAGQAHCGINGCGCGPMWPVRSTAPAYEYLARKTKSSEPSFRPAAMVRLGTRHPGRDRKACGKQASAGNRLRGPTRHDPGLAPEAERIKVGCAGIGNSK